MLRWLLCVLLLHIGQGWAAPIPGLHATGVDDSGAPLPGGAVDPHWRLVARPGAADPASRAWVVAEGYPIPPWVANGPASKWIGPQADQSGGNSPGDYHYRLTFVLSDLDAATARLTGRWSSDNAGIGIRLNGRETGLVSDSDFTGWSSEFVLHDGLVQGTNTLEFVVNNAGSGVNPTGFRAELSGTADPLPGPGTPPSLRSEPADVVVAPRERVSFRVSARGSPPLHYQWRFQGLPLSGETTDTLVIASATPARVGGYDVVVGNASGSVTSRVARLTIVGSGLNGRETEPPGPSTRRTGLVVSEILRQAPARPDGRRLEFVELYNTNPFFEDLGGWSLTGTFPFTFPPGTRLAGNSHLVIAPVPEDLRAVHGITNVLGGFPMDPAAGPLVVGLRKASGAVVLEVAAEDDGLWPVAAFGAGHSLILAAPTHGERQPRAWAASAVIGGSPGRMDPAPQGPWEGVVLNEILGHPGPGQTDLVELHNRGFASVDVSGCVVRVRGAASLRLPEGTVLEAGGFLEVPAPGLEVDAAGGVVEVLTPDQTRVLDALRHGGLPQGGGYGRSPDGGPVWSHLRQPTPGRANARPAPPPVVLNELHYHPLNGGTGGGDGEFVELFNPGSAPVSLAGWRFTDGIGFEFPPGVILPPRGYLVVAADADAFRSAHPHLAPEIVLGNFTGALSDGGERVVLSRPEVEVRTVEGATIMRTVWVAVEEVDYADGGRWGHGADGGGGSLERVEGRADSRLATSWAASDETGRAPWTTVEVTGALTLPHPGVPSADQLQVLLLGEGEALVDEVGVWVAGGNRVANGSFENGVGGWVLQGTHRPSRAENREGFGSRRSLRVVATDRGDHVANQARTALTTPIPHGTTATIRARVRWLRGHPEILLRLRNGALEAVGRLTVPPFGGTPGAPNSRQIANAPPSITAVTHRPILPAAGQTVRVMARIADPDGVGQVRLRSRLDPAPVFEETPMTDDGEGPDEVAGDGIFTGELRGQPTGTLVAFRVWAKDAAEPGDGGPAEGVYPGETSGRECLVRFGEAAPVGAFGTYRIWMTREAHDRWAAREKMSNEDVPVTFVDGAHRVIYEAGAHYSGSSYTSPSYTSPTGALCGYNVRFPDDDLFLGADGLTLDWPIRDNTHQRESLMFWFLEQLGLPNMYRRSVHLLVNGVRRGTIYEDVQQPGRDTVEQWFPDDDRGSLWKTDCWNEFDTQGNRIDPCVLNTLERFPGSGPLKPARYRWNWRPRAVGASANEFADLFRLVETMNTAGSAYEPAVEALVDVDHWMRTFAMNDLASYWDGFGNPNAKNTFLYKPVRAPWKLMCWDFDVGLGVFNDPPNAPLFEVNDPTIRRLYRTPAFVRRYWAALEESMNGFFRTGGGSALDTLLDARYEAFRAAGLALAGPAAIKNWIVQRRAFLASQLRTVSAPFSVLHPAGAGLRSTNAWATLAGTAPVAVRVLRINDAEVAARWTTVSNWTVSVPLGPGVNRLRVEGRDVHGGPVAGASADLDVEFIGRPPDPPALRFNEWMASNQEGPVDPADGDHDDWFEIHHAGETPVDLGGFSLSDDPARPTRHVLPPGTWIAPGGFLLVWADGEPEQTRPGFGVHVSFRLDRDGSDLILTDPFGQIVDAVRFGPQATDVSEGRWGDGAPGGSFALSRPTPGEPNAPPRETAQDFGLTARVDPELREVVLRWTAVAGRSYVVEARSEIGSGGAWEPVATPVVADGTTVAWRGPIAGVEAARFYRIRPLP